MNDKTQGITDSDLEAAIEALIKTHGVSAQQAATVLGTMCDNYVHHADEP